MQTLSYKDKNTVIPFFVKYNITHFFSAVSYINIRLFQTATRSFFKFVLLLRQSMPNKYMYGEYAIENNELC